VAPTLTGFLHAGLCLGLSPKAGPQGPLPVSRQGIFIFFLVKYKPLKYNNIYTYPTWGYSIGWLMALSSMLCIPLWIFIKLWKTEGTLPEKFRKLTIPSADLKMRGKLGAGPRTVMVNDCDAKLKGDGTIAAITEKETHF